MGNRRRLCYWWKTSIKANSVYAQLNVVTGGMVSYMCATWSPDTRVSNRVHWPSSPCGALRRVSCRCVKCASGKWTKFAYVFCVLAKTRASSWWKIVGINWSNTGGITHELEMLMYIYNLCLTHRLRDASRMPQDCQICRHMWAGQMLYLSVCVYIYVCVSVSVYVLTAELNAT